MSRCCSTAAVPRYRRSSRRSIRRPSTRSPSAICTATTSGASRIWSSSSTSPVGPRRSRSPDHAGSRNGCARGIGALSGFLPQDEDPFRHQRDGAWRERNGARRRTGERAAGDARGRGRAAWPARARRGDKLIAYSGDATWSDELARVAKGADPSSATRRSSILTTHRTSRIARSWPKRDSWIASGSCSAPWRGDARADR